MPDIRGYRLGGAAIALTLGCALFGVAHAQQELPANAGVVLGEVDRCGSGKETPAPGVSVGIQEGSTGLVKTDSNGQFVLQIGPGTYTVIATADDGQTAVRPYVPVDTGVAIDIGVLDLGMGAGDCGFDTGGAAPAVVAPTAVPSATPEPTVEATPTPTAVPAPTATPDASQQEPDSSQQDVPTDQQP
jgi:carboxypeptidase family protein